MTATTARTSGVVSRWRKYLCISLCIFLRLAAFLSLIGGTPIDSNYEALQSAVMAWRGNPPTPAYTYGKISTRGAGGVHGVSNLCYEFCQTKTEFDFPGIVSFAAASKSFCRYVYLYGNFRSGRAVYSFGVLIVHVLFFCKLLRFCGLFLCALQLFTCKLQTHVHCTKPNQLNVRAPLGDFLCNWWTTGDRAFLFRQIQV